LLFAKIRKIDTSRKTLKTDSKSDWTGGEQLLSGRRSKSLRGCSTLASTFRPSRGARRTGLDEVAAIERKIVLTHTKGFQELPRLLGTST
jgi:hypothetical protein